MSTRTTIAAAVFAAIMPLLASTGEAAVFTGRVISVADGDTIRVITEDDRNIRIRIQGIDAPEHDQEFGLEAQALLSRLVKGKDVVVNSEDIDRYGRSLAQVAYFDTDIGLYMLEHGLAWTYRNYLSSLPSDWRRAYLEAERQAREARRGLWQSDNPMPPWSYRKLKRDKDQAAAEAQEQENGESVRRASEELAEHFGKLKEAISAGEQENPDHKTHRENVAKKATYWELCAQISESLARWIITAIKSLFSW